MKVNGEYFPFEYDNEKLYLPFCAPTLDELDLYACYEMTSPYDAYIMEQLKHNKTINPKRKQQNSNATISIEDIPMNEWRKRFAMLPEEIVKKSFNCTTQYYLNAELENRQDQREHIKSRFPGLRIKQQNEMAASDKFFHLW
jgi:hypothetical protein